MHEPDQAGSSVDLYCLAGPKGSSKMSLHCLLPAPGKHSNVSFSFGGIKLYSAMTRGIVLKISSCEDCVTA